MKTAEDPELNIKRADNVHKCLNLLKKMAYSSDNHKPILEGGFMNFMEKLDDDYKLFKEDGEPDTNNKNLGFSVNSKNVFLDTLDEMLTNERSSSKDIEERFIATVACKAAVKANMDLNKEEVDSLIQNLLTLKNPYTCPHGRPTTIKFSKEELNKKLN